MDKERILIVDDELAARIGLSDLLTEWGYETQIAGDGEEALDRFEEYEPNVVILDMKMPKLDGVGVLKQLHDSLDSTYILMLTAYGTIDVAVEAMKLGAYDFLTKPVDTTRLKIALEKISEHRRTSKEVELLRRQLRALGSFGSLIGKSAPMKSVYRIIEQAAPSDASVLICGESGTGKELGAKTIHDLSPRKHEPFVAVNCAAIPENLLESEMFGHEKGAFTGALQRRIGCFEMANAGTLFLDEIAEMSENTQAKLLRVLEERKFRRIGGSTEIKVDVRIVSATNQDIERAMEAGMLREDLFYRLNVFTITLAPLRDRKSDIPLLVQAFIDDFNERNKKQIRSLDNVALEIMMDHHWQGNVRELRNVIERAVIVCDGDLIKPKHLPRALIKGGSAGRKLTLNVGITYKEMEQKFILDTLKHCGGNKTKAAKLMGIALKTLHNKLNTFSDLSSEEP